MLNSWVDIVAVVFPPSFVDSLAPVSLSPLVRSCGLCRIGSAAVGFCPIFAGCQVSAQSLSLGKAALNAALKTFLAASKPGFPKAAGASRRSFKGGTCTAIEGLGSRWPRLADKQF